MTVLEYFDYEKQQLEDLRAVRSLRAKDAIYKIMFDTLAEHKGLVAGALRKLESELQAYRADLSKVRRAETPYDVKKTMSQFGFYEPEEADDFANVVGDMPEPFSCEDCNKAECENTEQATSDGSDKAYAAEKSKVELKEFLKPSKKPKCAGQRKSSHGKGQEKSE